MRYLSRDPFARITYFSCVAREYNSCDWCGAFLEGACTHLEARRVKRLYQYGAEHDSRAGVHWTAKAFCSASCARSYGALPEVSR